MTEQQIIEWAREAGFSGSVAKMWPKYFASFAAIVEAHAKAEERERCAKVADRHSTCANDTPNVIAVAIRALKD
jgi:hypothetical protein